MVKLAIWMLIVSLFYIFLVFISVEKETKRTPYMMILEHFKSNHAVNNYVEPMRALKNADTPPCVYCSPNIEGDSGDNQRQPKEKTNMHGEEAQQLFEDIYGKTEQLVTRSDFDGLVSSLLLKEIGLVDEILFVHPKDVQDGKVIITANGYTF